MPQARGVTGGTPGGRTAGRELAPEAKDGTDRGLKSRGRLLSLLFLVRLLVDCYLESRLLKRTAVDCYLSTVLLVRMRTVMSAPTLDFSRLAH